MRPPEALCVNQKLRASTRSSMRQHKLYVSNQKLYIEGKPKDLWDKLARVKPEAVWSKPEAP